MKKKFLLGLIVSTLSFGALAENIGFAGTVSTSCAFSNITTGGLVATSTAGYYFLNGGLNGSGAPASVTVDYTGAPTFSITGVGNLDSSPNGTPSISVYTTGISFTDADNNANAISAGANSFDGLVTKSFLLDPTTVTQDVASVRMAARASAPFPVGNYTAHAVVTCQ